MTANRSLSYNFGFFDLSEPDFTRNFIAGRMNYLLAALPLEQDLAYYRQAGRGVSIQWLNLSEAQKAAYQPAPAVPGQAGKRALPLRLLHQQLRHQGPRRAR